MNLDFLLKKIDKGGEKVGCGIRPGFDKKMYNRYNSMLYNLMESNKDVEIVNIVFKMMDESYLSNMIQITTRIADSYDVNKTNTVLDSRLGTFDDDKVCGTCCQTNLTCPGHYGYIKLATPIIHPLMYDYVFKLLRGICQSCGNLIADERVLTGSTIDRLNKAESIGVRQHTCRFCNYTNLLVVKPNLAKVESSKKKDVSLITEMMPRLTAIKQEEGSIMSISELDSFLASIKERAKKALLIDDINLRSLIMRFLVVPPVNARPPVSVTGQVENSNLTSMLDYFLRVNNTLALDVTDVAKQNWFFMIIYKIIENEKPYIPYLKQYESIKTQLKGKDGIIRKNGVGKRMDFGSRTVLSPASETCIGQVSYPSKAAEEMTSPEVVTVYNIENLREKWYKGRIYAITPMTDGHPLYNQTIKWNPSVAESYKPYILDVCHKFLSDGDMVMFNRQPTLDKYSLMGNYVKIVERNQRVNGLNSCVTKPHHADFDGDEGNMYILQTMESQLETMLINNSRNNIISNSNGRPIISIQYHGIISLYMLTGDNILLDQEDWDEAFDLFWDGKSSFFAGNVHGFMEPEKRTRESPDNFFRRLAASGVNPRSGKALFSCILPEDLFYSRKGVVIERGILKQGIIDKDSVGGSSDNLIQVIANLFGIEAAADFLSNTQKMADWYLSMASISVSLHDVNPINLSNSELENFYLSTNPRIKNVTNAVMEGIHDAYRRIVAGEALEGAAEIAGWTAENIDTLRNMEGTFGLDRDYVPSIEYIVNSSIDEIKAKIKLLEKPDNLNAVEKEVRENNVISITEIVNSFNRQKGLKLLGEDNPIVKLYKSGANGSEGNASQMSISIGQTIVYGSRMLPVTAKTMAHPEGTRTMMFFEGLEDKDFDQDDVISAGYINSSYVRGLDAAQFIFMMSHERVGIITSRIATPVAGFLARMMNRFNDDLLVGGMGDVVSNQNMFINYGILDGLDDGKASVVYTEKHGKFQAPMNMQNIADKLMTRVTNAV